MTAQQLIAETLAAEAELHEVHARELELAVAKIREHAQTLRDTATELGYHPAIETHVN